MDFLCNRNLFAHIHMERIDIVIQVIYPRNNAIAFTIEARKSSGKPLGWCCQYRVVKLIFTLVLSNDIVHHFYSIIQSLPCLLIVCMPLAIDGDHGIVPSDKADTQGTCCDYIPYFIIAFERFSTLPHIITHHKGELTRQGGTLVRISLIELIGHQF